VPDPAAESGIPGPALAQLRRVCRHGLSLDETERVAYSYDNSRKHCLPDAVAFVESHQQVSQVVEICCQYRIPIVARGRGTGTTGGTVPLQHGLVLSLERMNRILHLDPDNRLIVVEPGITNAEVQRAAAQEGFFWAPDPTSAEYCTVGGNLGFNSAGPKAVKYGTTRENTLGLKAVIGTGETIITGVHTTKGVVGYDLTRLLIGSEGTLAIITEATLKLTPLPQNKITLQLVYQDVNSAAKAVSAIMRQPAIPCALEFMDRHSLDLIRHHAELQIPAQASALLIVEIDGYESSLREGADRLIAAASNNALIKSAVADNRQQAEQLWAARKQLSPALRKIAPKKINEDVVVPVSHIPQLIERLDALAEQYAITIVNFGHAGNGNIHVNLLIDPENREQAENAQACLSDLFDLVLSLGGTLSGEHGVGLEKRDFINREIDPVSMALMRKIKQQFDPQGILNPDKIFPLA